MVNVDARDAVDREHLVVDPEPGQVRGASGRHPADEHSLVRPLVGGGAQPSGNAQSEALVGSAEADLVDELLGFNRLSRSSGVARR